MITGSISIKSRITISGIITTSGVGGEGIISNSGIVTSCVGGEGIVTNSDITIADGVGI